MNSNEENDKWRRERKWKWANEAVLLEAYYYYYCVILLKTEGMIPVLTWWIWPESILTNYVILLILLKYWRVFIIEVLEGVLFWRKKLWQY